MLNLENVNGILIAPDGTYRSFGIHSNAPSSELTDLNYHNSSFRIELSTDPWFLQLQQDLDLKDVNDNIHRQTSDWASKGIVVMIHAGKEPTEFYLISAPVHITNQQKALFSENYNYLQEQISKHNTSFEAYAFGQNK